MRFVLALPARGMNRIGVFKNIAWLVNIFLCSSINCHFCERSEFYDCFQRWWDINFNEGWGLCCLKILIEQYRERCTPLKNLIAGWKYWIMACFSRILSAMRNRDAFFYFFFEKRKAHRVFCAFQGFSSKFYFESLSAQEKNFFLNFSKKKVKKRICALRFKKKAQNKNFRFAL